MYKKLQLFTLPYAVLAFLFCSSVVYAQTSSQIPTDLGGATYDTFLQVANSTGAGTLDPHAVVFYEVEATVSTPFFIAIDGADSGSANDENVILVADTIGSYLDVVGGTGALSDPVARRLTYTDRNQARSGGTLLSSTSYDNDDNAGWTYVGPFFPSQGELLGNKYYFRVVFSIDAAVVNRNSFRLDVSFSTSGDPSGSDQFRAFAYSWPIGLLGDSNGNAAGGTDRVYELYPFVAEGYGGNYALIASNNDVDNAQGAGDAQINVTGESRAYDNTLPGLDALTDAVVDTDGASAVTNNTRLLPTADQDSGTWRMTYTDAGGITTFTSNPAEFWNWLAPLTETVNAEQFYVPGISPAYEAGADADTNGTEEVFEIVRTYSALYEVPTPDRIAVNADDGTAPADGSEAVTLLVVDSNGDPSASILEVFVEVSGDARIASINGDTGGLPAASSYVTTTSDGLALLSITDSTPLTDDLGVVVTVTTNGAVAPGTSGTEADLAPNTTATVSIDFLTDPAPEVGSATNSSGDEGTTFALADVTVTDVDGGSITDPLDIRIVLPPELVAAGATFNPAATEVVGGTGPVGAVITYEAGNTVAFLDATGAFGAGETAVIQGLEIDAGGATPAAGNLALSFDGDTTGDVTDDNITSILTTSTVFVWEGGTSTVWTDGTNWAGGLAPSANDGTESIVIPIVTSANYPVLPAVWSIDDLSIDSTASLTLAGDNLTINGVFSNEGTVFLSGGGTININDTDSGTIDYSAGALQTLIDFGAVDYYDLVISNSALAQAAAAADIAVTNDLTASGNSALLGNATQLTIGGDLLITATTFIGAETTRFTDPSGGATSGAVSISVNAATNFENVVIDDGGGGAVYTATGNLRAINGTANFTITSGTVDFNGTSPEANGTFTNSGTVVLSAGTLTVGNLNSTGTINNTGANAISATGDLTISGTFSTPANSSISLVGTANTQNIDTGTVTLGNLEINNTNGTPTVTALSGIILSGNLTRTAGDLVMGANGLSVAGDVTYTAGTITSTGTVDLNGTANTQDVDFTGATLTNLTVNNTNGTPTVTATVGLTLSGNLTITAGNLVLNAAGGATIGGNLTFGGAGTLIDSGSTVALDGNWDNSAGGTYTATGEVRFLDNALTSTISGDTTFFGFVVPNTVGAKTLEFTAGSTQTVAATGTFDVQGQDAANRVVLVSGTPGTQWNLDVTGATTVTAAFLNVTDGDVLNTGTISATDSVDSGNNDTFNMAGVQPADPGNDAARWIFVAAPVSYTWDNGGVGTDWGTADNWNPAGVPGLIDDITIPDNFTYVVTLAANRSINDVTIQGNGDANDATLSLSGFNLTINGAFSNDGTIRLQGGEALEINGNSPPLAIDFDTDSGTAEYVGDGDGVADTFGLAAGNAYNNLTINSTVGTADVFQMGANTTVGAALTISAGTLSTNGSDLTVTGPADWTGGTVNFNLAAATHEFFDDVTAGTVTNGAAVAVVVDLTGTTTAQVNGNAQSFGTVTVTTTGPSKAVDLTGSINVIDLNVAATTSLRLDGSTAPVILGVADTGTIINDGGATGIQVTDDTNAVTIRETSGAGTATYTDSVPPAADIDLNGRSITLANIDYDADLLIDATEQVTLGGPVAVNNLQINNGAPAGILDVDGNDLTVDTNTIIAGTVSDTAAGGSLVLQTVTFNAGAVYPGGAATTDLSVAGVATVDMGAGNDLSIQNAGTIDFQANVVVTSVNNLTVGDANALQFGASVVTGNLSATAGGALTDAGVLSVGGTTTLVTTGADINLDSGNTYTGAILIDTNSGGGGNASITNAVGVVDLGNSDIDGNLTIGAGGNITDSGGIDVSGVVSLTANAGAGNIVLDDDAADTDRYGTLQLTANDATVIEDAIVDLGASTIGGNLIIESTFGAITDSGVVSVTGTSSFTVPDNRSILLNTVDNLYAGAVTFASAGTLNNVTVDNGLAFVVQSGLTLNGALNVVTDGLLTVSAPGGVNAGGIVTLDAQTGANVDINGALIGDGGVDLTAAGTILLGADVSSTNTNVDFNSATTIDIGAGAGATVSTAAGAGDITFAATIDGGSDLTLNAGTGDVTLSGLIGGTTPIGDGVGNSLTITAQNVALNGIENGGAAGATAGVQVTAGARITLTGTNDYRTAGAQSYSSGAEGTVFTTTLASELSGSSLTFTGDLYLDAAATTVTLLTDLTVTGRLVGYRGSWNLNSRTLTVGNDLALFGAAYQPDDVDFDAIDNPADPLDFAGADNTFFEYPDLKENAAALAYFPAGGVYNADATFGTAPTFAFSNLNNAQIDVSGDFYVNGLDLNATTWDLAVADNSAADPNADANYRWGSPYAVFLYGTVSNSQVPGAIAGGSGSIGAAAPVPGHTNNNVTDGTGNTAWDWNAGAPIPGWDFLVPEIQSVATRKDDVLFLDLTLQITNVGGAIDAQTGLVNYDNDTLAFDSAYQDELLAASTNAAPAVGLETFFLYTTNTRWNTDATGTSTSTSPGGTGTDRTGTGQAEIPNLSWTKGTFHSAGGRNPAINYNREISGAAFTGATDEAGPVLHTIEYGRGGNDNTLATPYNGHNYFHLFYSEAVDIGANANMSAATPIAQNLRSEDVLGDTDNRGGDIEMSGFDVLVEGYFSYTDPLGVGPLTRGSRTGGGPANALYRDDTFAPTGGTSEFDNPAQELRIYLSGYNEDYPFPGAWGGLDLFPGYHADVPDPGAGGVTVDVVANGAIVDGAGNQVDDLLDAPGGLNADPAGVAPGPAVTADWIDEWDVDSPVFSSFTVDFVSDPNVTLDYEIVSIINPVSELVTSLDFHVLDNSAIDYASLDEDVGGQDPNEPNNFGYWDPQSISTIGVDPNLQHTNVRNLEGLRDSTLNYPGDGITEFLAFSVTEVAGTPVSTFNVSIETDTVSNELFGPVGVNADDSYFRLDIVDGAGAPPWGVLTILEVSYDETGAYITDLAGNLLRTTAAPIRAIERTPPEIELAIAQLGGNEIFVQFSEPVWGDALRTVAIDQSLLEIVTGGYTITDLEILQTSAEGGGTIDGATAARLTLDGTLTAEAIFTERIGPAAAGGPFDNANNEMTAAAERRLSDLGIGIVEPVWATDAFGTNDAGNSDFRTIRTFDGSESLDNIDITLQARIVDTYATRFPLRLAYDIDVPDSVKVDGFWDIQAIPAPLSDVDVPPNTEARSLLPFEQVNLLRSFIIPGTDPEFASGSTLEFVFDLGPIPAVRLSTPDDLTSIAPWSFGITGGFIEQRGGVTILNNVIYPENEERTVITYDLDRPGMATVIVFDLGGSVVRTIHRGRQASGSYRYTWDGRNNSDRIVARGIYFIRVVAPGIDEYRKVIVARD